uniref:Uncharacterized protein n=1 Tax=Romanomermis culicivorax TaxID=13658 RepID=A0A915KYV1_ROMCU
MQQTAHIQNAGNRLLGAHLQMCSSHGHCTHNDASCRAQRPNSAGPSNAAATNNGRCYFCRTRAHPTDGCYRPCPHCRQIRVYRATACPNWNLTMPAALRILRPEVAQRALEFIANSTIRATPIDKILLDSEPSSPAVDTICRAVEQASCNAQPASVVVALP